MMQSIAVIVNQNNFKHQVA